MPVFHTKTIESILEPVAQQVSRLVILHEEAEDGNAMPDLSQSVRVVKTAVDNLAKVGRETVDTCNDSILKQDMPPAIQLVEESSNLLLEASELLRDDPYSGPARKKLIQGSRGILQGTSSLLLVFDESEVRKIIGVCKNVLEYLAITEVVDTMEDLVTFVKNLSPVLTRMSRDVDSREKELTHQVHREMLAKSRQQVTTLTPLLVSGVKSCIAAKKAEQGVREAQMSSEYVVRKMSDEIHEIIRVLQLTSYDEENWDESDVTVMKKLQNGIEGKVKSATGWLSDPGALVGSRGDKAIRQIIDDSRSIAGKCVHPADTEQILQSAKRLEANINTLSDLKKLGEGSSATAVSLAQEIQVNLKKLQQQTAHATITTERSGIRKPAPTLEGKVEQARQWLASTDLKDTGLGESAVRVLVQEGHKVASCCVGPKRQELMAVCQETERLTNQLIQLKTAGQVEEAKATAQAIDKNLAQLKTKIQDALVAQVAEDFVDISSPVKHLSEASLLLQGTAGRDDTFESRIKEFEEYALLLANSGGLVATAGGCNNKQTREAIIKSTEQVRDLTPQVVLAARVVFQNPTNQASVEHLNLLKQQWSGNMERVRTLVDEALDCRALIQAHEDSILRDTEKVEKGIKAQDAESIVVGTCNIARHADRVLQMAEGEAQNSEDPAYVNTVSQASIKLSAAIAPEVQSSKIVVLNMTDPTAAAKWRSNNETLLSAIREVKLAVTIQGQSDQAASEDTFPPPPDVSQLQIAGDETKAPPPSSDQTRRVRLSLAAAVTIANQEEEEAVFPVAQANQPIMMAAHSLHMETNQWSSKDNEIIVAAKKMALLMAKLNELVRGETGTKKDLIATARNIAEASEHVTQLARQLAAETTDKKMKMNLLTICERIPTIGTQLKILSTVKATMLGVQGSKEDEDATEMLEGCAQNLMQAVKETVRTAEAASIRIRVDSGYTIKWARQSPAYV